MLPAAPVCSNISAAALDAFEACYPGSIAALEGPNEANIQHFKRQRQLDRRGL